MSKVKKVTVKALICSRFFINTELPDYDDVLKSNIEKMKDYIWNKIETLTRKDMDDLIIEIEDWVI